MRAILVGFLMILPLAAATSATVIRDGAGDIQAHSSGLVNIAVPEIDILAVDLASNETSVAIDWAIADISARQPGDSGGLFLFTYEDLSGNGMVISQRSGENWVFVWQKFPFGGGPAQARNIVGKETPDGIHSEIPRTLIDGGLTRLRAGSLMLTKAPDGGLSGSGPVWFRDWAPDDGYGSDFTP